MFEFSIKLGLDPVNSLTSILKDLPRISQLNLGRLTKDTAAVFLVVKSLFFQ